MGAGGFIDPPHKDTKPKRVSWQVWKEHLVTLLKLTWPNILTSLIQLALPVTSTLAVGNIGPYVYIGAAALGNMYANATGFAVGSGLAMALDTLCSQAFGAKKYYLFIGTEETATWSQIWIRRLIPSLWPRIMFEAYRRYMLSQRIMWPITVSVGIVAPCHILFTYIFIYVFDLGFEGAAWATSCSYWLLFLTLVSLSWLRLKVLRGRAVTGHQKLTDMDDVDCRLDGGEVSDVGMDGDPLHTWPTLSMDVFRGWLAFLRLGIATAASLVIEWGSFEVNAAIASHLGEVPLAAHAVMANSAAVWYAFPIGVATASTALVGNMLGSGEPDRAYLYTRIAYVLALVYGVVNGALGLLYKDFLGKAYTEERAVIDLVSDMMLVMWLYGLVDALKAVGMAILRGSGRPSVTVFGNTVSCIVVGYPVAFLMVFKGNFGLQGLWFGMSSAWICAAAICGIVIVRTNWKLEAQKAAQRNADTELSTMRGNALAIAHPHLMKVVINAGDEEGVEMSESEGTEFSIGDGESEGDSFLSGGGVNEE